MISLLLILSFHRPVLLRTTIYVRQAKTGETRESWATKAHKESISTLLIFKTSHLFDLFFLQ